MAERARCWLRAWRWLQHLARAPGGGGQREAGLPGLWARLDGCLRRLGGIWAERRLAARGAPADLLSAWAVEAEVEFRRAQAEDTAGRRAAWREWRPGLLCS